MAGLAKDEDLQPPGRLFEEGDAAVPRRNLQKLPKGASKTRQRRTLRTASWEKRARVSPGPARISLKAPQARRETSWRFSPPGMVTSSGLECQRVSIPGHRLSTSPAVCPSQRPWSISIKPGWVSRPNPRREAVASAVPAARERGLDTTLSTEERRSAPAAERACLRPQLFKGVSLLPWKRPSRFQSVSPCLTRKIRFI